jgi:hypothetical protein
MFHLFGPNPRARSPVVASCQQRRPLWLTSLAICGALVFSANFATAQSVDGNIFCDGTEQDADGVSLVVRSGDVFTYVGGTVNAFVGGDFVHSFSDSATWVVPSALAGQIVEFLVDGGGSVTCTRTVVASAPAPAPSTAALISISVQASLTQNAINTNIAGRFGGPSFAASSSNAFVSSRGLDHFSATLGEPEFNGWVALDARRFTGTAVGHSGNVTVGFDRLISPDALIGAFAGVNDQDVTISSQDIRTLAPIYGLYMAQRRQDQMFFTGYLGFGRPEYTTPSEKFTSQRSILGLSLINKFEFKGISFSSSASVLASNEKLPASATRSADQLRNMQAIVALRAQPVQRFANGILPYASLGAEYRRQGSDLMAYDTFAKPRLGLGFDWQLAAGNLRFDLDYGATTSTTNDLGASLVYDFRF